MPFLHKQVVCDKYRIKNKNKKYTKSQYGTRNKYFLPSFSLQNFQILHTHSTKGIFGTSNLYVAAQHSTHVMIARKKKIYRYQKKVNIAQGDHYLRDIVKNYNFTSSQCLCLYCVDCCSHVCLPSPLSLLCSFMQFMFITDVLWT
jgi:hypothetical protein